MFKALFAAAAAISTTAGAAVAGPYVNVEANSSWFGDDYLATGTDFHVGYEGNAGQASWYVQGGPALISVDGADTDTELSGKAGVGFAATENLGIYGEFSFLTGDIETGYGTKLGVKYSF